MSPKSASYTTRKTLPVLQVLPRLKEGGVEESTLAMARYLKGLQGPVRWIPHVTASRGKGLPSLIETGAIYHPLPLHSKNPLLWLWLSYKLIEVIRTHRIAIVHARSRACAWPARFAAWWCGVPFVTTFHGHYGLGGGWLKRFYNSVMVAGPFVIANSQFTKAHIIKEYKVAPARIIVAARGIDPDIFDPERYPPEMREALRKSLRVPKGVPLLLLVGRLTAWKGQHLLLEALSLLPHRKFVVAFAGGAEGRGHYAEDLKGFAERLGLEENIRWLGARPDIPALLTASTLAFSCSTRPEAFGRAAIEAMAMGVPIIASAHGGSLETIVDGETGWLVKIEPNGANNGANNGEVLPQALADTIKKALRIKHSLATIGASARQHVLRHYTVAQMCGAEVEAYKRCHAARTRKGR
ncbi:MAG: glycosyltransferase family 4 protein [Pseudomonadota bacterium]